MPVIQKITYFKDGQELVWDTAPSLSDLFGNLTTTNSNVTVTVMSLNDWVKTLTTEEQAEFAEAEARRFANVQSRIDSGHITSNVITNTDGVVWNANSESAVTEIKSEPDPVWFAYWERWQSETGITHTETYTTV